MTYYQTSWPIHRTKVPPKACKCKAFVTLTQHGQQLISVQDDKQLHCIAGSKYDQATHINRSVSEMRVERPAEILSHTTAVELRSCLSAVLLIKEAVQCTEGHFVQSEVYRKVNACQNIK